MMLYKYQRINENSLSGLIQRTLWAADPISFNDPFELRLMHVQGDEINNVPGFEMIKQKYHGPLNDQELFKSLIAQIQTSLHQLRIIAYTEINDDILMWAHYAGDHKGICLGFEVDNPNEKGIYKVNYDDKYPELNLEKIWHIDGMTKILLNKSTHWSYEKEWRQTLIEPASFQRDYPGNLSEIIFGARISEDHQKLIREIFKVDKIAIKKASLHPKKYQVVIK
jgi:hypothetical protein